MFKKRVPFWSVLMVGFCAFIIAFVWLTGMQFTNNLPAVDNKAQVTLPSLSSIVKKAEPAVVNISTVRIIKGPGPVFKYFFGPFGEHDPFKDFFEKFFGDLPQEEMKQKSLDLAKLILVLIQMKELVKIVKD